MFFYLCKNSTKARIFHLLKKQVQIRAKKREVKFLLKAQKNLEVRKKKIGLPCLSKHTIFVVS